VVVSLAADFARNFSRPGTREREREVADLERERERESRSEREREVADFARSFSRPGASRGIFLLLSALLSSLELSDTKVYEP